MNIVFGDADEYFLSFDWKSRGESAYWDRLMVFLMDENEDLSTLSKSYTTGRIFNQTVFNTDPTWQNDLITLDGVQNTTKKIVFYWYNDNGGGANPPAAIDNIMIAECVAPTDVAVSNITEDSADLVWADNGGSSVWNVEYKKADATTWTSIEATTKAYSFSELRPNTTYDVRISGNCNETKYSEVSQFTTLCLATSSEREATICDNETYTDADFTLTAENEGLNYDTLDNQYGCDSIITLTLTVNPTYAPVFDVEICEGESYTENNFNVENPEPGVYQYTQDLQTINGCDSIVTLNLTVNPVYAIDIVTSICQNQSYTENNFNIENVELGTHTYTQDLQTINGCDSIVTLTLTVNPLLEASISPVICYGETFTYNGKDYTATGVYLDTVASSVTCDTAYTINLTVIRNQEERPVEICAGQTYQFKDEEWAIAGTYVRTLEGVNGDCDTTATYILTVNPLKDSTINEIITYGTSYEENGFSENQTGTYSLTTPSLLTGCDSTVTLNLSVTPLNNQTFDVAICEGETYTENGFNANQTGTYTREVEENNCTSTWTLNLTVNPVYDTVINATICEGVTYTENGFSADLAGTYYKNIQTINGCDSLVTLQLQMTDRLETEIEATICSSDVYPFNGEDLNVAGTYTANLTGVGGCDSVVTLTLHVNDVLTSEFDAAICEGQVYDWNGVACTENTDYTQTFTSVSGCDSVVTLHLTVYPVENTNEEVTICEGVSYTWNNQTYSQAGTYEVTLQNENGCDYTATLTLNIIPNNQNEEQISFCEGSSVMYKGVEYNQAGTYVLTEVNPQTQCPETTVLTVTALPVED